MSGVPTTSNAKPGARAEEDGAAGWGDVVPRVVPFEDSVSEARKIAIWSSIYKKVGVASAGEKELAGVRLAVYAYCCVNGTSREGAYEGEIQTYSGRVFLASVIPQSTSKMLIRKFMRANMNESYKALKESGIMEKNERFVARCADLGVGPDCAFAVADWMDECPLFTPAESKAHAASFARGLERSRRARGGRTLEQLEGERAGASMSAQGPEAVAAQPIEF